MVIAAGVFCTASDAFGLNDESVTNSRTSISISVVRNAPVLENNLACRLEVDSPSP